MKRLVELPFLSLLVLSPPLQAVEQVPFRDPAISLEDRVHDLVSRLTLDEKIDQLNFEAPAIDRLGIPAYNWWSEALHGVARNGRATVFPQAIGLAATWDEELVFRIASAISDEARAKYNASRAIGNTGRYAGLTFWSPNVNIFRDPRWGRGQETYGEDPYLTSRMGVAFVKGLQGDHPRFLKTAACAKHYAVHSGPEGDRHHFNASPSPKDLRETYLPAFQALVQEGKVEIVMCAYNRLYGEPCCGSRLLLQEILRREWGFQGHVTSDCWALADFHTSHKVTDSPEASAALAYATGVNVNCGSTSPYLRAAISQGLISESQIDQALLTLLKTRFRLGLFEPSGTVPFDQIGAEVINCAAHRALALEAAHKSVVLLKNDGVLPLRRNLGKIALLGPNASNGDVLLGNYFGVSGNLKTILEGLAEEIDPGTSLEYKHAFLLDRENINPVDWSTGEMQTSDAVIVAMGLSGLLEGEEGESLASPSRSDRFELALPPSQVDYLRKLRSQGDAPIIAVVTGGSPIALGEVYELADAVLFAWYPGEEGGSAIADIVFGEVSPSGRLPITFPRSVNQLPDYSDYSMKGRTYRYMAEEPQFPFGFGLSYATFEYGGLWLSRDALSADESLEIDVTVTNTGDRAAEEVVQCYLTKIGASVPVPYFDLKAFQRIRLWEGESRTVRFVLEPRDLMVVNESGERIFEPGQFRVSVAGSLPSPRSQALGAAPPASAVFSVR